MFPLIVILNRFPFTPAALPTFIATMGTSDFQAPPLPPLLFRLVGKRADFRVSADAWISWVTANSHYQARNGYLSRMEITGSPFVSVTLLLAGVLKPSAHFNGYFGTYHLHGRHYPLPLLLACFRAYASSNLLPSYLQGSIPGLWLAVTRTGFPPARICDIAQPQPKLTLCATSGKKIGCGLEGLYRFNGMVAPS